MDNIRSSRLKIYVCFPILTLLVAGAIFQVFQEMGGNARELKRLHQDMEDMQLMCGQQKTRRPEDNSAYWELQSMKEYVQRLVMQTLGAYIDDVNQFKKADGQFSCKGQLKPEENALISFHHHRINYAAEELGAGILKVNAPLNCGGYFTQWLLGHKFCANPPMNMLKPSMELGAYFCYKGSKASVLMRLAKTIIVDGISVTHVAKELTPNMNIENAPKDFDVYGIPLSNDKTIVPALGTWTYVNTSRELTQTFNVDNTAPFAKLVFHFNSNHGANHTCIYRIQVHGTLF